MSERASIPPLAIAVTAVLALVLLAHGAAPARTGGTLPSPVVYPVQRLPLSFSHRRHQAVAPDCGTCHDGALRSTRAGDVLVPGEAACRACHAIDRAQPTKAVPAGQPPARCDACHPRWNGRGSPARVVIPRPNLVFSHKAHADRRIPCARCHGDLRTVDLATREHLPRMAQCLECHDGRQASAACTTCHPAVAGGRLRTSFPEGRLVPSGALHGDAHDPFFQTRHAAVARRHEAYCASCHTREECQDCHDGVVRPFALHPGDYVRTHAVDARRQATDCGACHRVQTFCTGCHARTGVGPDPRTSGFAKASRARPGEPPRPPRAFHPLGWTTALGGVVPLHAVEAQRNLRACASCHREESCTACHARQANPHPPDWRVSARCDALLARARRTCLRCHADPGTLRCE